MNKKILSALPISLLMIGSLTGCSQSSSDTVVLRILNSEDYIYLNEGDPDALPDMIDQFAFHIKSTRDIDVTVVYDTSDTNETIYSELQTGKSNYDLINVSDYMAQKIVSAKLAVPLYQNGLEIPNYEKYASKEIKGRLDAIVAPQKHVWNPTTEQYEDVQAQLKDYAVGYMWGTLGILYNPRYYGSANDIEDPITVSMAEDMSSFSTLWDSKYKGTISIKNSMRDTYALGIMKAYEEEFQQIADLYNTSSKSEDDLLEYQSAFAEIFNRCDQKAVDDVYRELSTLKQNIFGLEVDSGKQDIVTKKIGVNLAWSGDAVYSMDQAEDPEQVGTNISELYYSVPDLGSNLWFDTWIMPKNPRSELQYELAHEFLDFLCDPVNATQNMDYTGYTSFIGGDSIIDLVRSWYDARYSEVYYEDEEYEIYWVDGANFGLVDYSDTLSSGHDQMKDEFALRYFVPYEDEQGILVIEPLSSQDLIDHGDLVYYENEQGEEVEKKYGNLLIADEECETVDLSYFFEGTSDEYEAEDFIFYSDCYLPFDDNKAVGRQFFCQYPNKETINRTAVMRDYGDNNKLVMKMWENFKSDPLPTGSIIIFAVILGAIAAIGAVILANFLIKRHLRILRKGKDKK